MNSKRPAIKYENTVPGTFVRRVNRFIAEVMINDNLERVHVKNTGRLRELLVPGAKVTLQKAADPGRKTAYDLISVYKTELEWVNIDSLAPNKLVKLWLMDQDFDIVKPEFGQALRRAVEAGVQVVCYGCRVEADSIEIVSDPICSPTKFCPITA